MDTDLNQIRGSLNSVNCPSPWLLPLILLDVFPTKIYIRIFHKTLIPSLFLFYLGAQPEGKDGREDKWEVKEKES